MPSEQIANQIRLNEMYIRRIKNAMNNNDINNFSSLASVKGLGLTSLTKALILIDD